MAIASINFPARSFFLPASNPPALATAANASFLAFDDTTEETCYTPRIRFNGYASGTLTAKALVSFQTEIVVTDEAVLVVSVEAITPGSADDVTSESFDTENSAEIDPPDATTKTVEVTVTLTNRDSVADGDWVRFKVARKVGDAADTATDDLYVYGMEISEA